MNIIEIRARKASDKPLTMVTCYDYWSARLLASTSIDMILVGDSAAMVMHGYKDTVPATVNLLATHVSAVRKGAPDKFLIADLPFLSYRGDLNTTVAAVHELMRQGANAVKLEAYDGNHEAIVHLVQSGVPVMGHIGLTPQFVNQFGGFRVQGREREQQQKILADARGLEAAGCFAVVLECIPQTLAREVTAAVSIPTIGIGAGVECDGQVLVLQDLLGVSEFKPRFVRRYLDGGDLIKDAIERFCQDVRTRRFPSVEEGYE